MYIISEKLTTVSCTILYDPHYRSIFEKMELKINLIKA